MNVSNALINTAELILISDVDCVMLNYMYMQSLHSLLHYSQLRQTEYRCKMILVRAMVFNATFKQYFSYIGGQFYWWRKSGYAEKTVTCRKSDKLYYIMLHQYTAPLAGFELTTLVVICTHCIGSCKSNYHIIMTMTTSVVWMTYLPGYRTRLIIPGNMSRNRGRSFRNPAISEPPFACDQLLAASDLWTIT